VSLSRAPTRFALVVVLCSLVSEVRAAGVTMNWTDCAAPARLPASTAPDLTWYVSTSGTDPTSCTQASGYTFRTIQKAASCAIGGETIYVRGGTYSNPSTGQVLNLSNKHPSRRVLIAGYPGETAILDGSGVTPQWGAIVNLDASSNFSLQDLVVQNTGANGSGGSFGITARSASNINLYYNTVQNISNNGILVGGSNITATGNLIHHTASIRLDTGGGFYNDGLCTDSHALSSNITFSFNHVDDNGGECIGAYGIYGGSVAHNKVHDCVNVNIYVSASQNMYVEGNWSYTTGETWNINNQHAAGIQLEVEAVDTSQGYTLNNIEVVNNLIERVGQGIRFARRCVDPVSPGPGCSAPQPPPANPLAESITNVWIAYNDFRYTHLNPIKIDQPRGYSDGNRILYNVSLHYNGFLYIDSWTGWYEAGDWWANTAPSAQTPGWVDPDGYGYQNAYKLRSDSTLADSLPSVNIEPPQDYFCRARVNWPVSQGAYEATP